MDEDEIRAALRSMERDRLCNTKSSYSANAILYPNHKMSFTNKHLAYLKTHPALKPEHYLANLKLLIKKRI